MTSPLVAVTAAAGKTGAAVVRELRAREHGVRALVRRRDARSEALVRLGAEVVETDLFDGERMADALRGKGDAYVPELRGTRRIETRLASSPRQSIVVRNPAFMDIFPIPVPNLVTLADVVYRQPDIPARHRKIAADWDEAREESILARVIGGQMAAVPKS